MKRDAVAEDADGGVDVLVNLLVPETNAGAGAFVNRAQVRFCVGVVKYSQLTAD